MPLDCFVLFSSASTLIGLSGQSSYVAANSFLDTLAHHRKQKGLAAMSINWGVMKDVGMVANSSDLEKYAKAEGFEAVKMTDALRILSKIYNKSYAQMGILKLDATQCASYYSSLARTGYLSNLLENVKDDVKQQDFLESLLSAASKEAQLASIETQLISQVSKIIKAPIERINSSMTFKGLGIDSLMAIQLRNLLEKIFKCKLSVTTFWMQPSLSEYAVFLHEISLKEISNAKEIIKAGGDWLVIPKPNKNASMRLFCFHDAGGSSSLFNGWEEHLNTDVEMVCIELPGRGTRINEPAYLDMESLVKNLTAHLMQKLDKPFAFFGHSMGGALLFEVTRELRRLNQALPVKMFVSSTPWLGSYDKKQVEYTLTQAELVKRFPHLSHENIADEELQEILVNILRSDLQILTQYEFKREDAFEIPLIAIHGSKDQSVQQDQMEKWQKETNSSFKLISRNGGHRYIEHDPAFVATMVSDELLGGVQVVWKGALAERTISTTMSNVD